MSHVVFDTVVFVRALLNRRSIWARIVFDLHAEYSLFVSPPILREVIDVLQRPEIAGRFTAAPGRNMAAVLGVLRDANVVEIDESSIPRVCRDPKDDKFIATAVAAGARFLVTEDKDLLVLDPHEEIAIVDAATFLTRNVR